MSQPDRYFVLDRFHARHPARMVSDYPYLPGVKWRAGSRISAPVPDPLEITLDPLNPAASDQGPEMPEYFKGSIPLLRDDLVRAMMEAGVDNLELFPAVLRDPDSGRVHQDYWAVNIVGALAAADMARSEATVHPGGAVIDVDFDRLVIDPVRARGLLIFRLAESTNAILVHEALKDHLLTRGFDKLEFLDPERVAL